MTEQTIIWLVLLIVFVTTCIRATLGFGNALLAMPLLTLTVGIHIATPLVGLVSFTTAIFMLLGHWRHVDFGAAWRLVLASFFGIPLGLVMLTQAPEHLIKGLLGLVLILFGLYKLLQFELPRLQSSRTAYAFGFGAGVLGGAYNTNGPFVIIYGTLARWTPEQFRSTLQGYFLISGLVILASHAVAGLWTADVLWLFGATLPVTLLAIVLGNKLARFLPARRFDRLVHMVLVVMGILLFF